MPLAIVARDLARRLIDSESAGQAQDPASADAAAAVAACDRLYRDLSDWLGRDGCHALFTRSLAETRISFPILEQVSLSPRSRRYVEGAASVIMEHGNAATTSALEAMMGALIELLVRLIGEDMAIKLIGQTSAVLRSPGTSMPSTEEEA